MVKQMALGISGATAAVIGGFKLVRQLVDRGEETDAVAVAPGVPAEGSADVSLADLNDRAEATAAEASGTAVPAVTASKKSSKAELYDIAQKLGIEGRSKMTKDELLKAIEATG